MKSWQAVLAAVQTRDGSAAEVSARRMVTNTRDHAIEVLTNEGEEELSLLADQLSVDC